MGPLSPLMMIMGIVARRESLRSRPSSSRPPMRGMFRSSSITSGAWAAMLSRAFTPSSAATTSQSVPAKMRVIMR